MAQSGNVPVKCGGYTELPVFDSTHVGMWFEKCDAIFAANKVDDQLVKFVSVLQCLDLQASILARPFITRRGEFPNVYDALKLTLIEKASKGTRERIQVISVNHVCCELK